MNPSIKVVKGVSSGDARHGMERHFGVTHGATGAQGIFMAVQRVPPGGRTTLHRHTNCETAAYVMSGRVRVYEGEHGDTVQEAGPGDFMYIPANAWHVIENMSPTEWAEAVIARNASEEIVEEHPAQPKDAARRESPRNGVR